MSGASTGDLKTLKTQICQVLDQPEGPTVLLSSFWNLFHHLHHTYPNPKHYGVKKRAGLLALCSDVCSVVEKPGDHGNVKYVTRVKDKKSGALGKGTKSKVQGKSNISESADNSLDMAERSRHQRQRSGPYQQAGSGGGSHATGGDIYARFYGSSPDESHSLQAARNIPSRTFSNTNHSPAQGLVGWFGHASSSDVGSSHGRGQRAPPSVMGGPRGNHGNQGSFSGWPSLAHAASGSGPGQGRQHGQFQQRRGGSVPRMQVPKEQLNSVAEDCIDRLAEAREYVSPERVEKLILQHYKVDSLGEMGVNRLENIPVVNEHVRLLCKINAYIHAFVKVRSIGTLYELGENLRDYVPDKQDFDKLKIGPLVKQPLIYEFFKVPQDAVVLEIDTADILEHLRNYLSEKNIWTEKLDGSKFEEFMNFMATKYEADSAYHLGVRIRSLPLAVGVLKKAQRECGQAIRTSMSSYKEVAERDIALAFRTFTSSLIQKEAGICTMRQQYCKQPASKMTCEVFSKVNVLYHSLLYIMQTNSTPKHIVKQITRQHDAISQFIARFSDDKLAKQLFQAAVCCSQEQLHEQLQDMMGWGPQKEGDNNESQTQKAPPSIGELVTLTLKYLERCVMHGSLSLAHLTRIENKLLEDLHFADFSQLGQGTFLDFLGKNDAVKQFLEDCGGSIMGVGAGAKSTGGAESTYHPSLQDLLDFIRQTGLTQQNQVGELETLICSHYHVTTVKALGHGTISHLLTTLEKQRRHIQEPSVYYQAALCAKARLMWSGGSRQVGLMGHQSRESALACLQRCPLLEDLDRWSQWEHVFQPELGDLKEFLQKYGGVHNTHMQAKSTDSSKVTMTTNILALEVKPGELLKITGDTSPEKFANSALESDVRATCGHLVSLVVSNKGLENTPLALLGNHIKTSLLKMHASDMGGDIPGAPGGRRGGAGVVQFVLDCLATLPVIICQATANQVFLEPLSHVVGASKSKEMLAGQALASSHQRNRLQLLGWVLGVAEWSRSFEEQLEPPADCLHKVEPQIDPMLEDDVIDITSQTDSESSSDSEDDDFSLSDDEDDDDEIKVIKVTAGDKSNITIKEEQETADADMSIEIVNIDENETDAPSSESDQPDGVKEDSPEGPCKALIDQIRSEEFGIDIVLSEDGQKLMQKQQERLGRSLDRLSRDLYSKDTHFVLELIQNADDNDYTADILQAEGTQGPAVKFVVEAGTITVINNEVGFQEKNIRAICDVGRSTKGKHKYGYIGQKGIGFKSVFRVTDRPEIHSKGFHICFDVSSGPMGYILPHWISQEGSEDEMLNWTTRIVLPLKSSLCQQGESHSLVARFQDVHPSLLLFLHRLRAIAIDNQVDGYTLQMERRDVGNHIVEISHSGGVDRWLVVKKTLDASHISIQAKSGVEVESTELALAFPLQEKDQVKAQVLPQKQPVFAFLPLRSYGFRFVVQADFDVPSSREDVDKDSMWNQWLRTEIHTLFVEALETFKGHSKFTGLEAVCHFLQFVPLEDEVLDFFRPVASHILQQLRARPCLPSQPRHGAALEWKLPSQLVVAPDPLVHEVISPAMLRKQLSLSYLHSDVAAIMNQSLISSLGVQTLTTQHLIELGKALVIGLGSATARDVARVLPDLSKWLTCVYRSMDEFHPDNAILDMLRSLTMIPLADGSITNLQQRTVFFPLSHEEKKKYASSKDPLSELERDLHTVHPDLLRATDSVGNSQVGRLLEQLGVKQLTPSDIIHHHIIPCLKSGEWERKPRDLILGFMIYIKEALDRQPSLVNIEELQPIAVLLTNHGLRLPSLGSIHFTPAYGNRINLQADLPGYDWVLIDSSYLRPGAPAREIASWHEFLAKLGVQDFLSIQHDTITINKGELGNSPWAEYEDLVPVAEGYQIADCRCVEFASLAAENTQPGSIHAQMQLLLELIDRDWDSKYARYSVTQITDLEGHTLKEVPTSFALLLKGVSWLPAIRLVLAEGQGRLVESTELAEGSELFVRAPAIEKLLAHHVPYLDAQLSGQSSFSKFLGIQTSVSTDFICEQLTDWCCRDEDNEDEPEVFYTSLSHIKAVYLYLSDNLPPRQLQDLLHENPVIFLPSASGSASQNPHAVISGRFLSREEVWWEDPSGLFLKFHTGEGTAHLAGKFRESICSIYADMQDFFLRCARVQRVPQLNEYVQLLLNLTGAVGFHKALSDVLILFSTLGRDVLAAQEKSSPEGDILLKRITDLPSVLAQSQVFPAKSGQWVGLNTGPMIADDRQLERLFQGKYGVHFLDTGDRLSGPGRQKNKSRAEILRGVDPSAIRAFLRQCSVTLLSECVCIEYTTQLYQPCPQLQKYAHDVLPYLQQLIFTEYPDVYERLNTAGIPQQLPSMQFGQVGKLELVYTLKDKPSAVVALSETCRITDTNQFYVLEGRVEAYNDLNKELARFFSRGDQTCQREIRNFLLELLPLVQQASPELESFMREHELVTLPTDEIPWQIPEPVIVHPIPRTPSPDVTYIGEVPAWENATGERGEAASDSGEVKSGLKAWPPMANAGGMDQKGGARMQTGIWPPPARPDYMDTRELPAGLRPSRISRDGGEGGQQSGGDNSRQEGSDGPHSSRLSHSASGSSQPAGDSNRTQSATPTSSGGHHAENSDSKSTEGPHSGWHSGGVSGSVRSHSPSTTGGEDHGPRGSDQGPRDEAPHRGQHDPVQQTEGDDSVQHETRDAGEERQYPSPKKRLRDDSESSQQGGAPTPKRAPGTNYALPEWTHAAAELLYEELPFGAGLELPDDLNVGDQEKDFSVGLWGEQLVYNYLCKQMAQPGSDVTEVTWVNQEHESKEPFDLIVKMKDIYGKGEIETVYIEVKSTEFNEKTFFEISAQEVRFAQEKQQQFHLYRVFNAGKKAVRLTKLENLSQKMDYQQVRLCMLV